MSKPLHIKLLTTLRAAGIGVEVNISHFLIDNFEKPNTELDFEEYNKEANASRYFLKDLSVYRGFIKFEAENEYAYNRIKLTDNNQPRLWYDTIEIKPFITSQGLDYLEEYEKQKLDKKLNRSFFDINKAAKTSYTNQLFIGAITIILAGLSSWLAYQSNHKSDTTAISVDSLRLEISKWRTQAIQKQTPITLSKGVPHRP